MTTEIAAAQAVVEAKVDAEQAKGEAQAATVAAVTAEAAAGAAVAEATQVKELAEREVANATLDAEQRIAAYATELKTCRDEIASLRLQLTDMTTRNESIQAELMQLAWLKEIATMETETKGKAPNSGESSATAGNTSDSETGKTSKQESSKKEESQEGGEKGKQPEASATEKKEEKAQAAGAKHRWL